MVDSLLGKILDNQMRSSVFHDLMRYHVREILLVASLYDSYIIEKEGQVSEQIFGEYFQLNISNAPRITSVSSSENALKELQKRDFNLVVLMMGNDKETPIKLSKEIKKINKDIPILLLLNNNSDIAFISKYNDKLEAIDKIFVWNGDSRIFLAMVKYIEDKLNVKRDTEKGLVRVILLVEDSVKYYSRYLPILYTVVIKQTQNLISEEADQFHKILRMRARPKVLLASSYEEAVSFYKEYKDYVLCVISDVKYEKDNILDEEAGLKLVEYLKSELPDLPTLLQSSDSYNEEKARKMQSTFINKNSEFLQQQLKDFFIQNLGFGAFVFKDKHQNSISYANTIEELESSLRIIPDESLLYHSRKNHFSTWLMARGEIEIARKLKPISVEDFKDTDELREALISFVRKERYERRKGEVIDFDKSELEESSYIIKLSNGSLGGKGRGLAFVSHLIGNINFSEIVPGIDVKMPKTSIIGTDEFDLFLENNNISHTLYSENDYKKIKTRFLTGKLTNTLIKKLRKYLEIIKNPIAVRSSGLFEDSLLHPFSGVYTTFLLPNNNENLEVRLKFVMDAIKLVYASLFSPVARNYFDAINYKIEEEKMAVVLQEVVGTNYGDIYYPHISGVAQSYNYYPYSYMKPEDGLSVIALGLGRYVVEGEKAYRFCPKYPKLEMASANTTASQEDFYALDMRHQYFNLLEGEDSTLIKVKLEAAKEHGILNYCCSIFDISNNRVVPGISGYGPKIVNFANILKYNYIPLAKTIENVLNIVEYAMQTPVEIEFAVNITKTNKQNPAFYLLQIKPLIKGEHLVDIDMNTIDESELILFTKQGMGNGVIDTITDVIYVDNDIFDKSKTVDMVQEIELLNQMMKRENRQYILIGPGRWGTSDRWLGIPVVWSQICNAKIIVETTFKGFEVDASLGSHFFHNITSMNVGYFTVQNNSKTDYIKWDIIKSKEIINQTSNFRHIRFEKPVKVMMDGKQGISLIQF